MINLKLEMNNYKRYYRVYMFFCLSHNLVYLLYSVLIAVTVLDLSAFVSQKTTRGYEYIVSFMLMCLLLLNSYNRYIAQQ